MKCNCCGKQEAVSFIGYAQLYKPCCDKANKESVRDQYNNRRHTKIDEDLLVIYHSQGLSDRAITKELIEIRGIKISQTGITRARHRLGLKANNKSWKKTEEIDSKQCYDNSLWRAKQWKKQHPERVKIQFQEWQQTNRKQRTELMRVWRLTNQLKEIDEYTKMLFSHRSIPARILNIGIQKSLFTRGLLKLGALISKLSAPWRKWLNSPKR